VDNEKIIILKSFNRGSLSLKTIPIWQKINQVIDLGSHAETH